MVTPTQSKRDLIMSTAKTLFIEKGFRGTTIASIAESAGIAKGSVYSYFSSKLDIVQALFLQSDEKNQQLVDQLLKNSQKNGVQFLEEYLVQEFQEALNERTFIQAFLSEEMVIMDANVMAVVQECRINYHFSQQKVLHHAYGDTITPWLYDIVSLVNGLLQEYMIYLTLDDANFSIQRCAKLLAFCLDSAINALQTSNVKPLLTQDNFPLTQGIDNSERQHLQAVQILENITQEAQDMSSVQKQQVLETVSLISAELDSEVINTILVRALIANLRPYGELNVYRRRLADVLDVELI